MQTRPALLVTAMLVFTQVPIGPVVRSLVLRYYACKSARFWVEHLFWCLDAEVSVEL